MRSKNQDARVKKQGQIGTEMDKLLSQNPNYIQAKTELDKIQKTNNSNNNIKNIY